MPDAQDCRYRLQRITDTPDCQHRLQRINCRYLSFRQENSRILQFYHIVYYQLSPRRRRHHQGRELFLHHDILPSVWQELNV
jgi:hypothetical protein